jgi:hypothetical protein
VAIPRFLCGRTHPCRLRTAPFWPRWKALSCVLTVCRVLWGPISRVAFVTTMLNRTSLLRVVLLLFRGRMRPRAKTSSWEQGPDFDIVGTCEYLSYVRAFRSQSYGVLVRFSSPTGCISVRVTVTLSVMSDNLSLQSSRSMFGVLLVDSTSWIWI